MPQPASQPAPDSKTQQQAPRRAYHGQRWKRSASKSMCVSAPRREDYGIQPRLCPRRMAHGPWLAPTPVGCQHLVRLRVVSLRNTFHRRRASWIHFDRGLHACVLNPQRECSPPGVHLHSRHAAAAASTKKTHCGLLNRPNSAKHPLPSTCPTVLQSHPHLPHWASYGSPDAKPCNVQLCTLPTTPRARPATDPLAGASVEKLASAPASDRLAARPGAASVGDDCVGSTGCEHGRSCPRLPFELPIHESHLRPSIRRTKQCQRRRLVGPGPK